MIYTSYFAKNRTLEKANIVGVSIALYTPKYWRGVEFKKLAPTPDILEQYKQSRDPLIYQIRYRDEVLSKLDPHAVVKELKVLVGKRDVALLCYETASSFCHRHLVADWLTSHSIFCEEFREA